SEQREAQPQLLDRAVDLVQEPGNPLHLVDHHPTARLERPQLGSEQRRVGQEILKKPLVEKVEAVSAREGLAGPGALADSASTEQEEAALRRDRDPLEY